MTMIQAMNDPKYKGKHVIVIAGKVFTAKTGERAAEIIEEVHKKYPKETPEVTYLPRADTLILATWR